MNKKILAILGVTVVLIVFFVGSCTGCLYYRQSQYSKTAVPYIKEVFPKIAQWNPSEISSYMAPAALKNTSEEELGRLLMWFSTLGEFQSMEEPSSGGFNIGASDQLGRYTILTYSFKATFEAGEADVAIRLLVVPDGFKIFGFNLSSKALIPG